MTAISGIKFQMKIDIKIDAATEDSLRHLIDKGIPESRKRLVTEVAANVVEKTAADNPVRSGRSRAGWQAALEQIASGPVAMDTDRVAQGGEGRSTTTHDQTTTLVTSTNTVPYIAFLEYGTSKMAPFAMLRQSLAAVMGTIAGKFRLKS